MMAQPPQLPEEPAAKIGNLRIRRPRSKNEAKLIEELRRYDRQRAQATKRMRTVIAKLVKAGMVETEDDGGSP